MGDRHWFWPEMRTISLMLDGIDNVVAVAVLERSDRVREFSLEGVSSLVCWGKFAAVMLGTFPGADACGTAVG